MRSLLIIVGLSFMACQNADQRHSYDPANGLSVPESDQNTLMDLSAHKKDVFLQKECIRFDIDLNFGGKQILDGNIIWSTDSRFGMLSSAAGDTTIIIDDMVWHNGSAERDAQVRFGAYTWSYFFLLPYKIEDEGVNLEPIESTHHQIGQEVFKMTFDRDVGDAPDDWYVLHKNKKSGLLELAAYIVTAGQSIEEAEKDPHSIEYSDFVEVDGIPIAQAWTFWAWRHDKGNTEQLGDASLFNVAFGDSDILIKESTEVPEHFRRAAR